MLFYYIIKSKNNHIKYKPNMGFLVFQICFVDYGNQCSMSISSASEPESSLMTLTGSEGRGRGAINRGTAIFEEIWYFYVVVVGSTLSLPSCRVKAKVGGGGGGEGGLSLGVLVFEGVLSQFSF